MKVKNILEEQGRERWVLVLGVWLVSMLRTLFSEQTLKGMGKGVLDRGFCSVAQPLSLCLEAPVSMQ